MAETSKAEITSLTQTIGSLGGLELTFQHPIVVFEQLDGHVPARQLVVAEPLVQLLHLLDIGIEPIILLFGILSSLPHERFHLLELKLLIQDMLFEKNNQPVLRLAASLHLVVARVILVKSFIKWIW